MTKTLKINWQQLINRRQTLFNTIALSLLIALLVFVIVPRKWEATALVSIGEVGDLGTVEPSASAVLRMSSPFFIRNALNKVGYPELFDDFLPRQFGGKGLLDIHQSHGVNMIEIRFRAASAEQAKKLVEVWIDGLTTIHARLAQEQIAENMASAARLESLLMMETNPDLRSRQLLLRAETPHLEPKYGAALGISRESFLSPKYRPTASIEPVYTTDEPVFPKPLYFVALGILLGLLSCIAIVLLDEHNWTVQQDD